MRKKQLYAILLAGALAAGSTSPAVWAAEDTASVSETAAAGENLEPAEDENVQPTEVPAEPTEAPAEEVPAEPTAAPTEPAEVPAAGGASAEPTETPAEETPVPGETESANSGDQENGEEAEQEDTGISIVTTAADGSETVTYYTSLQEAVDAVTTTGDSGETTVIRITKMLSLSNTVTVSGKKVCIQATAADISIVRGDSGSGIFDGDMFSVAGSGSELQFAVGDGASLTVNGDNGKGEEAPSAGSIVNVGSGAAFGLSSGVTLTGSNSSANGGAVMNNGGSLVLRGGTITGNKGSNGAVYTNTDVAVQGSVSVKDNTGANLYLDADAAIVVTGAMSDASVSFTHGSAADQKIVIKAGNTGEGTQLGQEEFKTAVSQFLYDGSEYTVELGSDGVSAVLKKNSEETPVPSVSPSVTPSVTVTPGPEPTTTPSSSFLAYQSGSLKWVDHNTISVGMSTTKDCKWYYFFVDADTSTSVIQGMYDSSRAVNPAKANTTFTIKVENVPEADSWLVVAAEPTSGNVQMRVLKLNSEAFKKKRPAATPSGTTRAPRTYSVSESKVTGLEEPLKFYPNTFYEFRVTGAGQNDEAPYVSGDERWIPMYWSTAQNPGNNQKNTTWRIGSGSGITQAATYNMYIFFKKQIYNGFEWTDTDVIESITTQFRSAEITDDELTELTATPGIDYSGNGGSSGYSAELTATAAASSKDGGSTSKSAVSTADESPIGTMSALAAFSLAAGGYILMRKRKKES